MLLLLLEVPVLLSSVLLVSTTAKVLVSRSLISRTNVVFLFLCVVAAPANARTMCCQRIVLHAFGVSVASLGSFPLSDQVSWTAV